MAEKKKVIIDVEVKGDETIKELNQDLKETKDNIQETSESGSKLGGISESLEGLGGAAGAASKGVLALGKQLATVIATNPYLLAIAAVLGTVIGAFKLLQAAYNKSEKSQNKMAVATAKLKGIFNLLLKVLTPIVDFLIDSFATAIDTVIKGFVGLTAAVGDFLSWLGFDKAGTSVKNFATEVKDASDDMSELTRLTNEYNAASRESEKIQLDYQNRAEKIRQQRDDETKTVAERIALNAKLGKVLKAQSAEELKLANMAVKLAKDRIRLDGESTDNLDALAEAQLKVAEINERITSQESEQLSALNGLRKENADNIKAANERRLTDVKATLEAEALALEEHSQERLDKEKEAAAAQLKLDLANTELTNGEKLLLNAQYIQTLKEMDEEFEEYKKEKALTDAEEATLKLEEQAEKANIDFENKYAIAQAHADAFLAIEKDRIAKERAAELENAKKTGADVLLINKKYDEQEKALAAETAKYKLGVASGIATAIAKIAGENTELGKAAAVAGVTIDAAQAIIGTWAGYASMGPWGIAGAVAQTAMIGVMAAKSIKDITSVKKPTKGGGGGTPSISSAPVAPQVSPNVPTESTQYVRQFRETSEVDLQDGNTSQKVYVLESDITSTQNKVETVESETTF